MGQLTKREREAYTRLLAERDHLKAEVEAFERVGWIDRNGLGALHNLNEWRPEFTDWVPAFVKR